MRANLRVPAVVGFVVLVVGCASSRHPSPADPSPASAAPSRTAPVTSSRSSLPAPALPVPTIPGHPLPPDKQQDQQAIASRIASARAHAGVKPSALPPQANAVVTPSESWAFGIVQTGQDSMFAGLAETGVWGGIANGTDVVLVVTPSNPDGTYTHYSDRTLPGPYRITSASDTVVHLVAGNGRNFTLNAGNDTFGG